MVGVQIQPRIKITMVDGVEIMQTAVGAMKNQMRIKKITIIHPWVMDGEVPIQIKTRVVGIVITIIIIQHQITIQN